MVSPPFKLKMFTGSVCVLLTSVSLKLIKMKIKLIYATTSSWEKRKTKWRVRGKWRRLILFFFLWSELIFYDPNWSESNFILFLFFYSSWSDPDWRSELIRSNFCTWLPKTFVCPVPRIPQSRWNGAAELHISVDLLCGITAAAELHISVDLLCVITAAELHN